MSMDETESVAFSLDTTQSEGVSSECLANDYSEGTSSDDVDSMHEGSPSHSSAIADDNVSSDGPSVDRSTLGWEMVDGKVAIAFFPDFIVYRKLKWNCTDFKVVFLENCLRASGSTAHGGLCIKLAIEDIFDIRSQRCGRNEMVEVKINVIAGCSQQVGNLDGSSSVEEIKFCVVDALWHEKVEEIISLNVKYKALWNFMLDTEEEMDMEALVSHKALPVPKNFFPNFVDNFEELIYPEEDPDAVSISMRDVDMLKPDTFINDTIIDFYIMHLKNTMISPEERSKFHFFNCFFFRKLANMDKDPSSAFDGRAAFLRVRKWTRKVDLFSKEFIFIPVNYNYHWTLVVICHPGEIVKISGENSENLPRVPCILHMDSLRGSHANLKDRIQSYLLEEWKERQRGIDESFASKFMNLRFVPLELPQQQNLYDCGLFLLHYLESFLEARVVNFSPFMIKKSEIPDFLTSKWFLPDEPYTKRSAIIRLIHGLLNKHTFSASGEQHCPSNNSKSDNEKENAPEVIGAGLIPLMDGCNDQRIPISKGGVGIEMNLLQAFSTKSPQEVSNGSGLVLREFFDSMSSATLLLDVKHQASALQYQSENYSNNRSSHGIHENSCSFPTCVSSGSIVAEKCPDGVTSIDDCMDHPVHESVGNTEGSRKPEVCSSDDRMDLANHESGGNTESFRKRDSASGVSEGISGSPCPHMIDHHDSAVYRNSFLKNLPELSLQDNKTFVQEGGGITDDQLVADVLESQHHHAAKKMRLMCSLEMDNSATNLSEDLHL